MNKERRIYELKEKFNDRVSWRKKLLIQIFIISLILIPVSTYAVKEIEVNVKKTKNLNKLKYKNKKNNKILKNLKAEKEKNRFQQKKMKEIINRMFFNMEDSDIIEYFNEKAKENDLEIIKINTERYDGNEPENNNKDKFNEINFNFNIDGQIDNINKFILDIEENKDGISFEAIDIEKNIENKGLYNLRLEVKIFQISTELKNLKKFKNEKDKYRKILNKSLNYLENTEINKEKLNFEEDTGLLKKYEESIIKDRSEEEESGVKDIQKNVKEIKKNEEKNIDINKYEVKQDEEQKNIRNCNCKYIEEIEVISEYEEESFEINELDLEKKPQEYILYNEEEIDSIKKTSDYINYNPIFIE